MTITIEHIGGKKRDRAPNDKDNAKGFQSMAHCSSKRGAAPPRGSTAGPLSAGACRREITAWEAEFVVPIYCMIWPNV